MSTMDEMFQKCINVQDVFAGHNCWLFSRRDQFVLYIAVLHTVVKNRLSFSFSNAYLIKFLHLLGWDASPVFVSFILKLFYDLVANEFNLDFFFEDCNCQQHNVLCAYSKLSIKRPVLLNHLVWIFPNSLY